MDAKVIAIANQKGGVGKTTTCINLSSCLTELKKKVLTVDLDPQGNTTSGLGIQKNSVQTTVYELLLGSNSIDECILHKVMPNLDLLPSTVNLSGAEIELIGIQEKEFILKRSLDTVRKQYDYILIDCPPSLNMLTVNALAAADSILIPIQCEYYALEGLSQLLHTINLVQDRVNHGLSIEGVVFTMYDSRTNLSSQVVDNVRNHLKQYVFKTIIPRNVRLAEAPSYGMPITKYDPKSTGAESYRMLAKEIIKKNK